MKWILKTIRQILMIPAFRWHERGYTVAEIHRILPQCTTDEITAIIHNHSTENGARRR